MVLEHKSIRLFGKMVFEKATIHPPFKKPYPMQDEACFVYILRGQNNAVSALEHLQISEKEAVLMKCGSYLSRMLPAQTTGTYEAVAVHFYPEVLKRVYENDVPAFLQQTPENKPANAMVKVKADALLEKYFDSMLFYFANPELVNEELLILKVKELFLLLSNTRNAPQVKDILHNLFTPRYVGFKETIEAHIYSSLGLEDLAQLTNRSISSFKREFRQVYKESPARYIKNRKLEHAAKLLHATSLNISAIAYDCGFNDLSNFSNSFREKYGLTPSAYRKAQIKKPWK